uniref:Uncharacterized protein n=1 Tax=Physcomitrium patens TaxID=3218 RepID=A0A2K1KEB9_PHYPA|nr:hypothetical protein PHYPA_008463 [Physcomitrium patens]
MHKRLWSILLGNAQAGAMQIQGVTAMQAPLSAVRSELRVRGSWPSWKEEDSVRCPPYLRLCDKSRAARPPQRQKQLWCISMGVCRRQCLFCINAPCGAPTHLLPALLLLPPSVRSYSP